MSEKSTRRTVKDIDHTHPHTDEPFGTSGVYERGSGTPPGDRGTDQEQGGDGRSSDSSGATR